MQYDEVHMTSSMCTGREELEPFFPGEAPSIGGEPSLELRWPRLRRLEMLAFTRAVRLPPASALEGCAAPVMADSTCMRVSRLAELH
jgi:hypothetical protein